MKKKIVRALASIAGLVYHNRTTHMAGWHQYLNKKTDWKSLNLLNFIQESRRFWHCERKVCYIQITECNLNILYNQTSAHVDIHNIFNLT